jgi:hypothetical protein
VIWKDGSFGYDQYIEVEAYFEPGSYTKTAQLILRGGQSGFWNPFFDHGYRAQIQENDVNLYNATGPGQHHNLGVVSGLNLPLHAWTKVGFGVFGTGANTRLQFWLDEELILDVYDQTGASHDDGGHVALGSSNHINRSMKYENVFGTVDQVIPEPPQLGVYAVASLVGLLLLRHRLKSDKGMANRHRT